MSRSQAYDAVQQLRADLLGESKVDPGLLVRMNERLEHVESRQDRLERNPMVWMGSHLRYVGGLAATIATIAVGPLFGGWLKAKMGW